MSSILGVQPHTLKQHGPVTRDDATGEAIVPAPTVSTIDVTVQPMSGKDRQLLPEGLRHRDGSKLYTKSELTPADQHLGITGDIVVIDGADFEVIRVGHQPEILPHYKALAVRVQEGDPDA